MQKALLVIILSAFLASFSWAQDSLDNSRGEELILDDRSGLQSLDWNEQRLNDYREDSSYDYTEKQPQDNWLTRFRTWLGRMWDSFWQWLLGDGEISGFWLQLIQALPYLIVAGIIVFMVWLLIRLNPGAKVLASPPDPEVILAEDEKLIRHADLQALIDQAIAAGEYRLALRYYYLQILRGLGKVGWIKYESDKTNRDYSKELGPREIHSRFDQATYWYEYIWYGGFLIDEGQFRQAEILFQDLNQQIESGHE